MEIISLLTDPLVGVPVALVYGIVIMLWFRKADRSEYRWRELPILLSPAICYLLLPILGRLLAAEGFQSGPKYHPVTCSIPAVLFLLEIPLALWTVWRMRGVRLIMLVLSALLFYASFVAGLYADMSISGNWL